MERIEIMDNIYEPLRTQAAIISCAIDAINTSGHGEDTELALISAVRNLWLISENVKIMAEGQGAN